MPTYFLKGVYRELLDRGISEDTCRRFGYFSRHDPDGVPCLVAPYYTCNPDWAEWPLTAQKVRRLCYYKKKNQAYRWVGNPKYVSFFGMQLWKHLQEEEVEGDSRQPFIVITEGEVDCMTVSQVLDHEFPVVSVPHGAASGKKAILAHIEFLELFDTVVLMFDMDAPGQNAAEECAALFPYGKCEVAQLPFKDANECHQMQWDIDIVVSIQKATGFPLLCDCCFTEFS